MKTDNTIVPAIVVVGYNRPDSLRRLLLSIAEADYNRQDIPLIISIDFAPDNAGVITIANKFEWKFGTKIVRTYDHNIGLRSHVLACGDLSEQYGGVLILEDDIVVSPAFYHYAEQAMNFYQNSPSVAGIALYSHDWNGYAREHFQPLYNGYDAYFGQFSVTWGQGWTQGQWKKFRAWYSAQKTELLDRSDVPVMVNHWGTNSWGKFFVHYILEYNRFYVMPYHAVATCFADAGENIKNATMDQQTNLSWKSDLKYRFPSSEQAVHYDLFFENMDLPGFLDHIVGASDCVVTGSKNMKSKVLIDLYELHVGSVKCDVLLTCRKMNLPEIASYGMLMRPIENNVLHQIEGNGIHLYRVPNGVVHLKQKKKITYPELNYAAQGMPWQNALKYGFIRFYHGGVMCARAFMKHFFKGIR